MIDTSAKIELDTLIKVRESLINIFINEANGVWQRFNFIIAVELAFFAGAFTIGNGKSSIESEITFCIICFIGIMFSIVSMRALNRLWNWHGEYYTRIVEIENKIDQLCENNSLSGVGPMPLAFIRNNNSVNDLNKNYNVERTRLDIFSRIFTEVVLFVLIPGSDRKKYFDYVEKRPTHKMLQLLISLWTAILLVKIVKLIISNWATIYQIRVLLGSVLLFAIVNLWICFSERAK